MARRLHDTDGEAAQRQGVPLLVVALVVLRQAEEHHIHVLGRLVGDVLLVDVHRHVGVFLQQRPDGGGVIKVTVGQQDVLQTAAGAADHVGHLLRLVAWIDEGADSGLLVAQQVAVGGNEANPDGIDFHGIFSFIKHRWDVNGRVEDSVGIA